MYQTLKVEKIDSIDIVEIHRPEALNALNSIVLRELENYIDTLTNETRILILTGSGEKAFVAGADIKEISILNSVSAKEFALRGQSTFRKLEKISQVVVGAINGFALGGGLELALSCDFLFCSSNAKFGLPEVSLGLIPGFGGTQRLSRYLGLAKAREMIFSGKHYSANEALEMGLVNKIIDDKVSEKNLSDKTSSRSILIQETVEFCKGLLLKSSLGIAHSKRSLNNGYDLSLDEGLMVEAQEFASLFGSKDQIEGVSAFLEKRKPKF